MQPIEFEKIFRLTLLRHPLRQSRARKDSSHAQANMGAG
jgi:hypothetical protein